MDWYSIDAGIPQEARFVWVVLEFGNTGCYVVKPARYEKGAWIDGNTGEKIEEQPILFTYPKTPEVPSMCHKGFLIDKVDSFVTAILEDLHDRYGDKMELRFLNRGDENKFQIDNKELGMRLTTAWFTPGTTEDEFREYFEEKIAKCAQYEKIWVVYNGCVIVDGNWGIEISVVGLNVPKEEDIATNEE